MVRLGELHDRETVHVKHEKSGLGLFAGAMFFLVLALIVVICYMVYAFGGVGGGRTVIEHQTVKMDSESGAPGMPKSFSSDESSSNQSSDEGQSSEQGQSSGKSD